MILYTALRLQQQNTNQTWNSQQTSHTSPWRASNRMSLVKILENIDRVITATHCIYNFKYRYFILCVNIQPTYRYACPGLPHVDPLHFGYRWTGGSRRYIYYWYLCSRRIDHLAFDFYLENTLYITHGEKHVYITLQSITGLRRA